MAPISITLSTAILFGIAVPVTVSAAEDEITGKDITAYLYSKEKNETLKCLFKSSMPDMPYISTVDFCRNVFKGDASEVKNTDGTYTLSNDTGSMVINTDSDILYFEEFEKFMGSEADSDGTMLNSPYCHPLGKTIDGETKSLTLDIGEYGIDILEDEDRTYLPASCLSLLFSQTYNAAEFSEDSIYFVHCSDLMTGESYFDRTSVYEDDHRSQELIDLTYNELCFAIDKLYGRPSKAEIAASIEEKGLDKTLDEYSDITRRAKEMIMSDSKIDLIFGLCSLAQVFSDGGHTCIEYPLLDSIGFYPDTTVGKTISDRMEDMSDRDAIAATAITLKTILEQEKMDVLKETRDSAYEKYETVKVWDDASKARLLRSGDTAVFVFNSFMNEAVDNFKWSLDFAKENGIKRFVLDISCNTGGSSDVVMYMIAMMTNKDKNSNTASMRLLQTLTGNISDDRYELDLDLDGEINDQDKDVYYDFEYAVLTSHFSFSCGNLLPTLAKDNGIAVIGEKSGGGACMLLINFTPELMPFTISGYEKMITAKNEDADYGITPDYELTKEVTDENDFTSTDYSGMYDIAAYSSMIDEFYGVTEEPSEKPSSEKPSKETSDTPSEESANKPFEEASDTPTEESANKPSAETSSNAPSNPADNNTFPTGDSNTAIPVILVMLAASTVIVLLSRKNGKHNKI